MEEQVTAWELSEECTEEKLDYRFKFVSKKGSYQGTASLYYRGGVLVIDPVDGPVGYRLYGEFEGESIFFP